jgi:hypothetical protein
MRTIITNGQAFNGISLVMVEKFIVFCSSPFYERANTIAVFSERNETSHVLKTLERDFEKVQDADHCTYYKSPNNSVLISIKLDHAQNSKAYEEIFSYYIQWFEKTFGKSLVLCLPECEDFQSMALGLISSCHRFISSDIEVKIYVESAHYNQIKPLLEKLQLVSHRRSQVSNFLLQSLSCSECCKFAYIPYKKPCCLRIVCARCALRDCSICGHCGVSLSTSQPYSELTALCGSAPYLCSCGVAVQFDAAAAHIQTCIKSEVECRLCRETIKFSSFTAHMRIDHMAALKQDLDLIIK